MAQYSLIDIKVRKIIPNPDKRIEIWDSKTPGFGVRVAPTGTKSFVLLYRQNGRARRMTLGRYPALSLADARQMAMDTLNSLTLGETPKLEEAKKKKIQRFDTTIKQFAFKHCARHNKEKTARETERLLVTYFACDWATKDIKEITRADVLKVLDGLVESGRDSTANHAFAAVRKLFNWCIERGLVETSPCSNVRMPARNKSRSRVLNDRELAKVWYGVEVQQYPFSPIVQLLILTGQRRSEVGEMRWNDIDFSEKLWSIAAERNKSKRPHSVPLTQSTLEIILSIPQSSDDGFLFPSVHSAERPFSGYSKCKKRLDEQSGVDDWVLHDLRRTMATGLAKLAIPPHVIERILNHSSGTFAGVAGVYNRFGYLPEMREALEMWEDHVKLLVKQD